MEADVLNCLNKQNAYITGGRDRDGRLLIIIPVPYELQLCTETNLVVCCTYLLTSLSDETKNGGLVIVIDAQKCPWRLARTYIKNVNSIFDEIQKINFIVIRPDAFWDKQRVENCAKSQKKGEPKILPKSRLIKYFELSQIPEELGGTFIYNHEQWIQNRVRIEEFKKSYEQAINDLENLQIILLDYKFIRASETKQILKICTTIYENVQKSIKAFIENGNKLIHEMTESQQNTPNMNTSFYMSQDLIDAKESIKIQLNEIEKKQIQSNISWLKLEKNIDDARELAILEEGVGFVTNWILGTAESLLNVQQKVGFDVQTADDLRQKHEILELQCWETYGFYAELLYKIDNFPILKDSFIHKDLMSQRDFMDFVCRSFATRLERRRNILITSLRFFRLVSEYFDKTSEVFESLVMGHKMDDYELASVTLQKLRDSQQNLDNVEMELEKEGEKLSDMLSMPVKDALGRDIGIDYSEDIGNIRDILDATIARRNIFVDSVELQKLTLEQIAHIHAYEKDAAIAIQWIDDLYNVMIKTHSHVGCNVYEIQTQKDELQAFQETAKGTFNFGCQLLSAGLALRQSCKLATSKNTEMKEKIDFIWKNLQIVSQEQMTRLRVSAVFHRSVEEHCTKLKDLKNSVIEVTDIDDLEQRRIYLRKYLACRERLLVEVGRMVRLGRLLKTRLKEPFMADEKHDGMSNTSEKSTHNNLPLTGNIISCDAISEKLSDVSRVAEALDHVLRDTHNGLEIVETNSSSSEKKSEGQNEDWNSSVKSSKSSIEDESFITASDCTCTPQSRSSSYHTASECRQSPWWESEQNSYDTDSLEIDPEVPSMHLLSGVISSTNVSFDESENSFLSAQRSPLFSLDTTDSDDTKKTSNDNLSQIGSFDSKQNDLINKPIENQPKVRDMSKVDQDNQAWSSYYQSLLAKQTIKRCL